MSCITCSCVWLLKRNFLFIVIRMYSTMHVSLSESSLQPPPSESKSFTISLIFISSDKHFLWSIFCTRTQSGVFHIACGAQNISWLVKPHWNFRPASWERGKVIQCFWCRWSAAMNKGMHWVKRQNSLFHNRSLARVQYTHFHGLQEGKLSQWNYKHGGV
jgi:hypothetical protein